MNGFVLDASVAIKWFVDDEPHTAEAKALLAAYSAGRLDLIAPDLLWFELCNVLWKAVRTRRITGTRATDSLVRMEQVGISTVSNRHLREDALMIALTHHRSVYDASYLALAATSACP